MSSSRQHLDLIFVHVPKAGGMAVNRILKRHFGRLLLQDSDAPGHPTAPMNLDPQGFLARSYNEGFPLLHQKRAVSGHIWIRKYDPIPADVRATVIRHPVARTISNYFFWKRWVNNAANVHPIQQYLIDSKLSIQEFAALPIMRNFYCNHIFRDTDMNSFDVIVDYDELRQDGRSVMRRIGIDSDVPPINETRSFDIEYDQKRLEIANDPKILSALADLLSDDIDFYERAIFKS